MQLNYRWLSKVFFGLLLFGCTSLFAKEPNANRTWLDSVNHVINSVESHDTVKVNALLDLAMHYYLKNPDTTFVICNTAFNIAEKINYERGLADVSGWFGYLYGTKGDVKASLKWHFESLKLDEKLGAKLGQAKTLNSIGSIYKDQGDYTNALKYYQLCYKISEEIGNMMGLSVSLTNIGAIHESMLEFDKAIANYQEALKIAVKVKSKTGEAYILNNLGVTHKKLVNKNITKNTPIDTIKKLSSPSLEYYQRSYNIFKEMDDKQGMAMLNNNLAKLYFDFKEYDKAEEHTNVGNNIAKLIGSVERQRNSSLMFKKIYTEEAELTNNDLQKMKLYEKALISFENYIAMRDCLKNAATEKEVIRQQTQYEFEKQQIVQEQMKKEAFRIQEERLTRRNNLQYSVIFLALLVVFGVILRLGNINMSVKVVEGLIFFAFLIFFEFLLVLLDPFVDSWSGGAPIYKLLINAVLAGVIFPAHSFFEHTLKHRMINKKH